MSDRAYLLARLPRLFADTSVRPLGVAEFVDLIGDAPVRAWCSAVLDWLRIANREASALQLPLPFVDAGEMPPDHFSTMNPWRNYYRRLDRLGTPEIIRLWAREDAAAIAHRANYRGAKSTLAGRFSPRADVAALVEGTTESIAEARQRDRRTLAYAFARLNQFLYGSSSDAPARLYTYAIQMLLLARIGVPLEAKYAA